MMTVQQEKFLVNKKILLAIESRPVSTLVAILCKEKGSTSVLVTHGEETVAQLERFTPNLIFCEYHARDIGGLAYGLFVRRHVGNTIPIIMLVKSREIDSAAASELRGNCQTVPIPFSLNDIAAAAKRAFDAPATASPSGLRFGPRKV